METKERIYWIDTLRFFDILSIYLFHLGEAGGRSYTFGSIYRVPLFFFIAGSLESLSKDNSPLPQYIFKRFKALMVPYFFFALFYLLLWAIFNNTGLGVLLPMLKQDFMAVRNHISAASLWFLPCLFVMEVMFRVLKMLLRDKWLILAASTVLFLVANNFLGFLPIQDPRWFWNMDSALHYIVYFALGYAVFSYLVNFLKQDTRGKQVLFWVLAAFAFGITALLYTGKDFITPLFARLGILSPVNMLAKAIPVIWLNVVLAWLLQGWALLRRIGSGTLWLCGYEQAYKLVISQLGGLAGIAGLGTQFANPLAALLYALVILLVSPYTVIPFGKSLYYNLLPFMTPRPKPVSDESPIPS